MRHDSTYSRFPASSRRCQPPRSSELQPRLHTLPKVLALVVCERLQRNFSRGCSTSWGADVDGEYSPRPLPAAGPASCELLQRRLHPLPKVLALVVGERLQGSFQPQLPQPPGPGRHLGGWGQGVGGRVVPQQIDDGPHGGDLEEVGGGGKAGANGLRGTAGRCCCCWC